MEIDASTYVSTPIAAPLNSGPDPAVQWIEVASFFQIPGIQIVGLAGQEVQEAKDRIRSALQASGFELPRKRIILNLSPSSIRKRGTGTDLSMALAVLSATEKYEISRKVMAWGELGLDGQIKSVGQLTRALFASIREGFDFLFLPREDLVEASSRLQLIESTYPGRKKPALIGVSKLKDAWQALGKVARGESPQTPFNVQEAEIEEFQTPIPKDLLPISPSLLRVLCVALSGSHHLFFYGPKGVGKTHALRWLETLLPVPSAEKILTQKLLLELKEGAGHLPGLQWSRRIGQHTRPAALTGYFHGDCFIPGEYSLAHGGLLIADELPEWPKDTRESLREPLELGSLTLTRVKGQLNLPAKFILAGNGNLCPCGGWPPELISRVSQVKKSRCRCQVSTRSQYLGRISGPIADRIDIFQVLSDSGNRLHPNPAEQVQRYREKILETRERLLQSWGNLPGELSGAEVEALLTTHPHWKGCPEISTAGSLRERHKLVRVALSLGAWEGLPAPLLTHFSEASCYRPDRLGITPDSLYS